MMKKLVFIRHGKSAWESPHDDRNRPLKTRGLEDAEIVAEVFAPHLNKEAKIYTSPAVRAKTTAEIFKQILKIEDSRFTKAEELYTFDDERILNFIKSREDTENQILLFGHNPAFTALVDDLGDEPIDNLPTTGLAMIEFPVSKWKDIRKGNTILMIFPKDLKSKN